MHRGDDAFCGRPGGIQHAFGQEARAVEGNLVLQACGCVVLDELHGAAAREEAGHGVGLERRNLGEQGLELHVGEGQAQFLDDGAARCRVALLEAFKGLVAGCVLPADPDGLLVAALHHGLAQAQRGLGIGVAGAEHVGGTQRPCGGQHAGVGNQVEHTRVARHLVDAHLHAGVHRADEHIHLVALHQLARVLHALAGLRLVVHLEPLDLASAELAALLVDGQAHTVFNGHAQLGKCAGVGQHEPHAHLAALRTHDGGQQQARGCCANEGGTAADDEAAGGHGACLLCLGLK